MATYSISEARENLAEVISTSKVEEVFIEKHGKPISVVISMEVYEKLIDAWEDIQDLALLETLDDEDDEPGIPMEQVFRELGIS